MCAWDVARVSSSQRRYQWQLLLSFRCQDELTECHLLPGLAAFSLCLNEETGVCGFYNDLGREGSAGCCRLWSISLGGGQEWPSG